MATPASWRLVGRKAELERIAQARSEGRAGIVIYGPPGLGKSRLAREALAHAQDEGARIGWVQATRSAASVPLGAFASLIPPEVRSDDPFELMQRSVEALRGGSRGSLLIALDDAQWLDPTSAALALHLASSATAFVVATVRSGETFPDAIVSLWKDAGAPRFELGLLSARETGDLVAEIVGGPLERSARRWAYETSGGNALYVRELVAGALDSDALKLVGGLWRLVGRPPVSASLTDLVASRMQDLGEDEQRAVELLALGEPLRLAELESLTSSRSLASLQEHGLVTVAGVTADAEVRLAHPLYGETLRSRMVSLRVRDLLLALVQTVQGRAELEPEDTVRLARWLSDAGEPIATGLLIRAARAANHAGDPGFGASFAQRALDAGAGVEASLLLARALTVQSQFEQAEAVLVAAEGTVQSQTDAFEYLQQQSEVLHWGLGRPAELRELLDRAAGWWPDPTWHERLEPLRLLLSQFEEFRGGLSRPAQILTDADLDPELRNRLEPIQVANLFYSGQARAAHELAERIRPALPVRTVTDAIALSLWCRIALEDGEHGPNSMNGRARRSMRPSVSPTTRPRVRLPIRWRAFARWPAAT